MSPERALTWLARLARVLSWPFARFDVDGGDAMNDAVDTGIIVVDHRSLFDVVAGVIIFHKYHRYPRVLIEKKYVDSKWTRPFARAIGAIPVDRAAGRGEAFSAAVDALQSGLTILLLPEGRISFDPDRPTATGRASTGVSRLAEASGAPVIAAGMIGTEQIWPARALPYLNPFRRRPVVTCRISDRPVVFTGTDHTERTEQAMAEVRRMMAECVAAAERRTPRALAA
ncbi:lysophospholipid acyltransferase family protein [Aquihabitans daechungensis]|uniref:lysophospholipid acyltransferase family protein n=1 Tax=Aquihabitans daechungensis TaxID=1052257 RepID=UPI003BA342B5